LGEEWRAAAGTAFGIFLVFEMKTGIREGGGMDEGCFGPSATAFLASSKEVASRNDGRKMSSSLPRSKKKRYYETISTHKI
jgi:hypothetical protein